MNKLFVLALAALFLIPPIAHAETDSQGAHLIKGRKSYQNIDNRDPSGNNDQNQASSNSTSAAENISQIEPAAGVEAEKENNEDKPLHEQMRLPRKGF